MSSPARRNLFGTSSEDSKRTFPTTQSPLVSGAGTSSGITAVTSQTLSSQADGPAAKVGVTRPSSLLFGAGTSTNVSPPKPNVQSKMAAFRSGALGANTLQPAATTAAPAAKPTSFLSANTNTSFSSGFGATPFGSSSTTTGSSLFGAAKPATTGGLFGSTGTTLGGLGASQQQQQQQVTQQQQVIQQYHPFVKACGHPQITGNENDKHIANLNQVAAALGVGKAPYKDGAQIQTFDMTNNVFEKFVGVAYNKISDRTDDEGVVSLVLKVPFGDLNSEEKKTKVLETIQNILGNQQTLKVLYAPGTAMRPLPDNCTEICIIVKEGGFVVSACKLAQVLNDAPRITQLESQLRVDKARVLPKVGMTKTQRDRYLETVPEGIDERIWRQAIAENPAPNRLMPVAVRGWEQLRDRQRAHVAETKIYHEAMHSLADRIEKAGNEHAKAQVEMEKIRNRHKQLSYRLIRILLAQWISARFSRQIDTDEDAIEAKCDTLLAQINRNHQIKFFIDKFYEILETKADKLQEAMFTQFDMTIEDQQYARRVLTELLYISERLIQTSNLQVEELEACRRTLEG